MPGGRRTDAGVDRLVALAEAQEKRERRKDTATVLAVFVSLGFFLFVGYCIWSIMHEAHPLH